MFLKENLLRGIWKLGMIEEFILSKDDVVRVVIVRIVFGKLLNRLLNFLYFLECSEVSEKLIEFDEFVGNNGN